MAILPSTGRRPPGGLARPWYARAGVIDGQHPMPMNEHYLKTLCRNRREFGDLIGLPVLDLNSSTLGYVRRVNAQPAGKLGPRRLQPVVGLLKTSRWRCRWKRWASKAGNWCPSGSLPANTLQHQPGMIRGPHLCPADAIVRIALARS